MDSCVEEAGEQSRESAEVSIKFYFDDMAEANNSQASELLESSQLSTDEEFKQTMASIVTSSYKSQEELLIGMAAGTQKVVPNKR